VQIRELGPGDESVLTRLDFDEPPQAPLSAGAAARFLADGRTHLWVAFDGEEPVGMLLAYELLRRRGDESLVHVYELGVAPTHRRRGIATALWDALAARLPGREGYTLVEASNAGAQAFYAAQGFAEPTERVVEVDGTLNDPDAGSVP
jgi:ribosomal protein S18 acetylase RimI-like enzyme